MGFIPGLQGWFKIHKSINVIHHVNKRKEPYGPVNWCRKSIWQNSASLIRTLEKVGIEGIYLNTIKAIYEKPTGNIILNGEKLRPFPLRSGTRQGYSLLSLLLNILLEVLASAVRQKNETKGIQIGKEEVKLSLLKDDIILLCGKPKRLHQKKISRTDTWIQQSHRI